MATKTSYTASAELWHAGELVAAGAELRLTAAQAKYLSVVPTPAPVAVVAIAPESESEFEEVVETAEVEPVKPAKPRRKAADDGERA